MIEITVNTKFSSELIEQTLVSDDPTFYDTEKRVIHLQEEGVIVALQKLGWSTPQQTEELQAENERLKIELEYARKKRGEFEDEVLELETIVERLKQQYESTPQRALKSVINLHKTPLRVSTTCDGGGRRVNLFLSHKLLLSEYRNGIDDIATITADDIKEDI